MDIAKTLGAKVAEKGVTIEVKHFCDDGNVWGMGHIDRHHPLFEKTVGIWVGAAVQHGLEPIQPFYSDKDTAVIKLRANVMLNGLVSELRLILSMFNAMTITKDIWHARND